MSLDESRLYLQTPRVANLATFSQNTFASFQIPLAIIYLFIYYLFIIIVIIIIQKRDQLQT